MDHERYIVEQIKEARDVRGMPIAELARTRRDIRPAVRAEQEGQGRQEALERK